MVDVLLGIDFFWVKVNCSVCMFVSRIIICEIFVKVFY